MSPSDKADLYMQLVKASVGRIPIALRGLRVAVRSGELLLIAYFERIPLAFEKDLIEDIASDAAGGLFALDLRPDVRCVVSLECVLESARVSNYEKAILEGAGYSYWAFVRHGETLSDLGEQFETEVVSASDYESLE